MEVDCRCDFFQDSNYNNTIVEGDKHLVSESFFSETDAVFRADMWQRVGRTDRRTARRTDTSPHITVVFFSSYQFPKTLSVTTLLLFWSCNVALKDISLYCVEWKICQTEYLQIDTLLLSTASLASFTQTLICLCCTSDTTTTDSFIQIATSPGLVKQ